MKEDWADGGSASAGTVREKRARLPSFVTREVEPLSEEDGHVHGDDEWKRLAALSGACLLFLIGARLVSGWAPGLALIFYGVAYITGAWEAAEEMWEHLRRGSLDVHFLMLAVAAGAACIGAYPEGALLLFLFSASGAMEHFAMGRTRREIGALLKGVPKMATLLEDGKEREISVEDLRPGHYVRVLPGSLIPVDMEVISGTSACDESNLTGESVPVTKNIGDTALGGTVNLWGVLDGMVLRIASESALQKVIRLIAHAQRLKAPSQRFTDRFGSGYTYAILGMCTVAFLGFWLVGGLPAFVSTEDAASAFYRAMTLLVVASPCALVISVPSAILSAIAAGARRGILFRGGAAVETLASIRIAAFDKTGTLTKGDLTLAEVHRHEGDVEKLQELAVTLASVTDHPLSRALKRAMCAAGARPGRATDVKQIPGRGVQAEWIGHRVALGNRDFVMETLGLSMARQPGAAVEVWVGGAGVLGQFTFADELRPEANVLVAALHAEKIQSVMLTGDRSDAAAAMARQAGVLDVRAGLSPEGKVEAIQELKRGGGKVAMIGDGVNDAPVLAAADVGVAMGAHGSDAALEQAEVVLMNDRLENFLVAMRISRGAAGIIHQNMVIALGTVVVMVLASILHAIPLAWGVAAHEGSTVLVVMNSLRLLFIRRH